MVAVGAVLRSVEKQRETDRIQQLAATRRQLDDASGQVAGLQDQGRYDEALEVARAALFVFESGDQEDHGLESRANSMVAVAEERVAEAAERKAVMVRNDVLLARCDELRLKQIDTLFNFGTRFLASDLEAAYGEAFREYGIDVDGADLVEALDTLVDSGIGAEVALALDDWASLRRELYGVESNEVEAVTALAFDLDPDPARTQLREALLSNDKAALLAFAGEEELSDLPPATIWVLSQGLTSFGLDEETFQVVRDGAIRYPGDFLLNIRLGDLYGDRDADDAAIRYLSAARAVRPDNAAVNALLGDRLAAVGDLPGAVAMYKEALRLNPGYTNVYPIMGGSQIILGDHEGARRSYESTLAAAPLDVEAQFGEFIARCAAGEFSSADLMEHWRTEQTVTGGRPWVTAWLLTFHPDPGWRDPVGALQIVASRREVTNDSGGLIEAGALIQLDRPQEALVALDRGEDFNDMVLGQRVIFAAISARAHFMLEDRERAEYYFDVCETIMKEIMYDGVEPWSDSPLVRLHRENAERLGR